MNPKELREKRNLIFADIQKLRDLSADEKHTWSAEDEANWIKANNDYDALTRKIEIGERAEQLAQYQNSLVGDQLIGREDFNGRDILKKQDKETTRGNSEVTEEHRALAFQSWFLVSRGDELSEEHRQACNLTKFNPYQRIIRFKLSPTDTLRAGQEAYRNNSARTAGSAARKAMQEARALSAVSGSAGGYTVPEGFVNSLEVNMLAFGGMLQVSEIIRTNQGNDLPWPTANDTSNTGEIIGENTSIGSSVDPIFGQIVFKAHKFSSKLVLIPPELLEDSAFNMESIIGAMLGERLGRISNTRFTTGVGGGNNPRGIVTAATLGVTAASAIAITADEVLDLQHSVDPAYRVGAGFMAHDGIILHLRKLKDGVGRYLWSSGLTDGVPDSIAGSPITVNQDMASTVATANKTLLFGQLNKYKIRQVNSIRFRRLDERYADTDQIGFIALFRQDGNLLDAGTAPVKYLQQA